ncbi:MAG: FAD-dependent monooxygenase [Candidatus Dormibacteraeota bacterium]|nr:FAD-dependent monooxygenase [Candidatus Dormibacteraeota bacterium]
MKSANGYQASADSDCQVLVVGAGPTGLVLAAELLARGIATRIVDKSDGVVLETRAGGIHARTLEVFDLMGLSEQFLERGQVVRRFRFYSDGKSLLNLDLSRSGSRFGFMLDIPQHETEALLRARIAELGGTIEQAVELLTLHQDEAGAAATVQDRAGEMHTITADFLVGCDGAHSRVRQELGLAFQGHPYPQDWLLADVRLSWDRPEDEVHAFFRSDGQPLICFPMRQHVWRLVLPYAGDRDRRLPTLEEIQQLLDLRAPERVIVSNPTWLATFRCHRRSTNAYRRGRVLLAGDAVHIHSPAGGQGMNTGIMDAHNLAWKLALVASDRAAGWLLDTYGEERGPVAAQVLALTHALVRFGSMSHPLTRGLRDTILPAASRLPAIQRRAVRRMSQVQVAYPASRLTRPDAAWGGPRPGDRAPDILVAGRAGRARLYEVLRSGRHVLLVSGSDPAGISESPALRPYHDVLVVVGGDFAGRRLTLRGRGGPVHLVRPDGYIAARGRLDGMAAVLDYLRQLFAAAELEKPQRIESSVDAGSERVAVA